MRRPRPHWTVRRLMVAVAAVGLVLGSGLALNRRMNRLNRRAIYHRVNAMAPEIDLGASFERRRAWHARMAEKYVHAASYPWLPVPSDPPAPAD